MTTLHDQTDRAVAALRAICTNPPDVGIVLGSGLGAVADMLADSQAIAYAAIPEFPAPTVAGHAGRFILGTCGGRQVAVLQGRFHYYEGHDLATLTLPIRVLKKLGVNTLILTAATGGIRGDLMPGDLCLLRDHINMLGMNPLRGVHDERLGPRFPDMTEVYGKRLREVASDAARGLNMKLSEVVYAAMPGPSYETPAEIRMLETMGADVVGMSTVPEAIVARQVGMDVLGLVVITNKAAGLSGQISHEEVLATGKAVEDRLKELLTAVLERL